MGGLGSGRPAGFGRDKVESCRFIDVYKLHREGCLKSGWRGGWQWSQDGEKVASINLRTEDSFLHLSFRARVGGGVWEDVEETVRIDRVSCQFGGSRPYFICPGVTCGRRVAKLHGAGRYFLCRHAERRKELEHRPLIRAQAFGQSLDPNKLEGLARYEVHLDRKLERMLSMLLRLKDLRVKTIEE